MTSRVEELQRMCDNINENGGLDSGKWHTALLAQIAQNLAVIADIMVADRKTENCSEKPNNCEELNAYRECVKSRSFWDSKHCDGCYFDERCPFDEPKDEPQTDCDHKCIQTEIGCEKTDCAWK